MVSRWLAIFLFSFLPFSGLAFQLSGTVTDSLGNSMPYVSVFVKNTTYGVATNLKGQYFLELQNGTYEIVFQAVGYERVNKPVTIAGGNKRLNITLLSAITQLNEVKVVADKKDPAYAIIRKAIDQRKRYRKPAESFTCNVYIKASLQKEYFSHDTLKRKERDTLPNLLTKENMNFVESYGTAHYLSPNNWKEIKTAVKDLSEKRKSTVIISIDNGSGDTYETDFVNRQLFKSNLSEAQFNFYYNNLDLASLVPVPFVSPISALAFASYKYRLEETFMQDGRWINRIEVIPRRKDAALFKGYIYIVEDLWNIKAVDLELDNSELFNFNYFRVLQEYELTSDSTWMISREEFFYNAKEGKKHILGNTVIKYSGYQLNPIFPKNFFRNELSVIEDNAYKKDSTWWAEIRPVTLKKEEQLFIQQQDSIAEYHKSAKYMLRKDSIFNRHNFWDYLLNGFGWKNSFKKQTFSFTPLVGQMYLIGVGGYRHAPGGSYEKEFSKAYKLDVDWLLNYGFKNKDLKGSLGASVLYNPKHFGRLHAEYRNSYELLNEYESIQAVLSRGNYVNDIFYSFGHEMELVNGLFADVTIDYGQKNPITNLKLASWSDDLFGDYNAPTDFTPYSELVVGLELRYTFGQQYMTAPYKKIILPGKWPTIALTYERGIPGFFDSTVDFDFLEFHFMDDIKIGTVGLSRIRLTAGTYLTTRNVQLADYKFFRRSDPWWFSNPLMSFQLLRPGTTHVATTKPYFQANYLHNFNGTVLNKVPLLKKLGMQSVAGAGILMMDDNNFRHGEVFCGIELPFRIRRQLMKIGCYYAISDSNQSNLSGEFKFGFDFFNRWTNKWSY